MFWGARNFIYTQFGPGIFPPAPPGIFWGPRGHGNSREGDVPRQCDSRELQGKGPRVPLVRDHAERAGPRALRGGLAGVHVPPGGRLGGPRKYVESSGAPRTRGGGGEGGCEGRGLWSTPRAREDTPSGSGAFRRRPETPPNRRGRSSGRGRARGSVQEEQRQGQEVRGHVFDVFGNFGASGVIDVFWGPEGARESAGTSAQARPPRPGRPRPGKAPWQFPLGPRARTPLERDLREGRADAAAKTQWVAPAGAAGGTP